VNKIEATVLTRVLCDSGSIIEPGILYLVGETVDNEISVIRRGASLWKAGRVSLIALVDGRTYKGYPEYTHWLQLLRKHGVPEDGVLKIPVSSNQDFNTLIEAQVVIAHMKELRIGTLVISASPFHQLIKFMMFVRVAMGVYPQLKIYNAVGETMDWNKEVRYSQRTQRLTRKELISNELNKILMYQENGDICSFKEIEHYFEWRDSQ